MPLSTRYQAQDIWREAVADLLEEKTQIFPFDKYHLLNRAIMSVSGTFYSLVGNDYMNEQTVTASLPAGGGSYSTSGTGTWVASTRVLAFANMSPAFSATDVGKMIGFRIAADQYFGIIESFPAAGTVKLVSSDTLPTSNGTVAYVMVFNTAFSGAYINISGIPIWRAADIKIFIKSSAVTKDNVEAVSLAKFNTWNATSNHNRNSIVFCLSGNKILVKGGYGLANLGTLTLFYPRVPEQITSEAQYVDVPDGALIEILILKLREMVSVRYNKTVDDNSEKIRVLVRDLFAQYSVSVENETIEQKVKALS
jgi:hypothetical protein